MALNSTLNSKSGSAAVLQKNSGQTFCMLVMVQIMEEESTRYNLMTQHMLHKGLKLFRERGVKAIGKEVGQLHNQVCFKPISVKLMNTNERRKAQLALAYLGKKGNGDIEGRVVFNRKPTREYLGKEESAS